MEEKFYFNLREAQIFQAVKWGRTPIFRFVAFFRKLFFILFLFFLLVSLSRSSPERFLALSLTALSFSITFRILEVFFNSKLKNPRLPNYKEGVNLAEFLSFEAAQVCWTAINFSSKKKLSEIPSGALLYFAIKGGKEIILYLPGRFYI